MEFIKQCRSFHYLGCLHTKRRFQNQFVDKIREAKRGGGQGQLNEFGIQVDRNKTTNMQRFLAATRHLKYILYIYISPILPSLATGLA